MLITPELFKNVILHLGASKQKAPQATVLKKIQENETIELVCEF